MAHHQARPGGQPLTLRLSDGFGFTCGLRCLCVELDTKCPCNLEDGRKAWIAVLAKGAIETLAAKPSVLGNLRYALRASNIPECPRDAGHIVWCFFEPGVEIGRYRLVDRP